MCLYCAAMDVQAAIMNQHTRIDEIRRLLDDTPPAEKRRQLEGLGRAAQRMLYEKAAGSEPITLDHFVPSGTPALQPVIHAGRNTLPIPGGIRLFEKRFARHDESSAELVGYNQSPTGPYIGPGYFVAVPTAGRPHWESRGAVVIDYYRVPTTAVPTGWPPVVDNGVGLQRFVYRGTRDFMRKVSEDVSIGAAFRGERPLDMYFVLVRQD